ncbi:MAG TPA: hypothetical protein VM617_04135 [Thermoanaerobaculia bacterium]|nr:hypothetical protein [Thermoanaerobaculia bacterium]
MSLKPCAALTLAAFLVPGFASAQSAQYTAPGAGAPAATKTKAEIEAQMADARWRLGPVRLAPYLGISGLSWVQNVFAGDGEETSDLTGTLGAGLTAYLPTGSNVFWVAQARPEYIYWADLAERRQAGGRYGVGLYADFNRLDLVAEGYRMEVQTQVTAEEPEPAIGEVDHLGAGASLRLTSRISLTAGAGIEEIANRAGDPDDPRSPAFALLDRREETARAGLRFEMSEKIHLEAGAERHETRFETEGRDLSSTGTSPYLRLTLTGNRLQLAGEVTRRSLDPEPGSALVPTEGTEGTLRLGLTPGWRFAIGLYASRSLLYSLAGDYSHFDAESYGVEVSAPFAGRWTMRLFAETGENDYTPLAPEVPVRTDDSFAYGASGSLEIREWLTYEFGYRRLELDSNQPGFDRQTSSVLSTLSLTTGSWIWQ